MSLNRRSHLQLVVFAVWPSPTQPAPPTQERQEGGAEMGNPLQQERGLPSRRPTHRILLLPKVTLVEELGIAQQPSGAQAQGHTQVEQPQQLNLTGTRLADGSSTAAQATAAHLLLEVPQRTLLRHLWCLHRHTHM